VIRSSLVLSVALLACSNNARPVSQPSNVSAPSSDAEPTTNLDLVAIDAPPSDGRFGLEIVIEATGPLFAVHWNGLSEEMEPPISIDSTPTSAVDILRSELDDARIETMPVTLILDRRVPWSFVAQVLQVAQATHHLQANFVFVSARATRPSRTWIAIDLGPGGTQLTLPGQTPWSDAHERVLAAAGAGKPVELH